VYAAVNFVITSVGPLGCLAMMIFAMPRSSSLPGCSNFRPVSKQKTIVGVLFGGPDREIVGSWRPLSKPRPSGLHG
jgi:hypothetical protein